MEAHSRLSEGSEAGPRLAQLSREIVQLHARMYGRGPTKARSYVVRDYALCVLRDVFTRAELTLIENGYGDLVRESRLKFLEAMRSEFVAVVEGLTGRSVEALLSQVEPEFGIATMVFVFEELPPPSSDGHHPTPSSDGYPTPSSDGRPEPA